MHPLSLALLLAAGSPAGGAEPGPAAAPPQLIQPDARPPAASTPPQTVRPDAPASPASVPPLSRAAIEKLGQGDRAFLDRDFRNALFAYMDAAYLAPGNPEPHVRLGRTYLALRYPARAVEQAEKALALDPANADARKLVEDAQKGERAPAPSRPARSPAVTTAPATASPAAPRVYRFVPDAEAAPAADASPRTAAPRDEAPAVAPEARAYAAPRVEAAVDPAPPAAAPQRGSSAGQRYREALALLQSREYEKAITVLSDAIAIDPLLAVAYSARASAEFGLRRYREAAADYRTTIELDAKLATPLYGLAECYRVLGEPTNAAEMYRRYADSRASDVREDLRAIAARRAQELR